MEVCTTSHLYINLPAGKTTKKPSVFWEQLQILHPGVVTGILKSFLAFTMEHTLDGSSVRHMTSSLFRTMAMNYEIMIIMIRVVLLAWLTGTSSWFEGYWIRSFSPQLILIITLDQIGISSFILRPTLPQHCLYTITVYLHKGEWQNCNVLLLSDG